MTALLIDYTAKDIYVTEEFKEFCKRNFIARDELRYRKQICVTTAALIIAVIALIVNTIFKFTGATKIKQKQIDSIKIDLKSINSNIYTVNEKMKEATIKIIEELKKKNELIPDKKIDARN